MNKSFLFVETAFHHEGDLEFMLRLIDEAASIGMDGVKFQVLINFDELISRVNPAYEVLKAYVFDYDQWCRIFDHAKHRGLALIVMPLDTGAFQLVDAYRKDIKYLEIHPISFYDADVKAKAKQSGVDVIVGVGGRSLEEIDEAMGYFGTKIKVLMVGFQAFPSVIEDIRLRKIQDLHLRYPEISIGYADHSGFDDPWAVESNTLAYALGATIFEKHITLQEGVKRVDFESAIGIEKLKAIKSKLDQAYQILYDYPDVFAMTPAEERYRGRQKIVVASRDISAGEVLSRKDLALKMTGALTGFSRYEHLVGKRLRQSVSIDTIIQPDDVSE